MSAVVIKMPLARRQFDAIVRWWIGRRAGAAGAVVDEFEGLVDRLTAFPELGRKRAARYVVVLPRSKVIVTYRFRPRLRQVEIVRLESAVGP